MLIPTAPSILDRLAITPSTIRWPHRRWLLSHQRQPLDGSFTLLPTKQPRVSLEFAVLDFLSILVIQRPRNDYHYYATTTSGDFQQDLRKVRSIWSIELCGSRENAYI
ncbi:hypothetical protein Agabi119p4_9688 [Agaricus bisporus var. burnettii]|uniref:Uncharacterized protein n=1 Tax=Agaricus bisporus var. burnettii TaxID=192524 RepID=A0A8H7EX20_AGABI|nr:hypothetical protein Agabi119p4_9688 [Agaricus bisporus var. burnettii]